MKNSDGLPERILKAIVLLSAVVALVPLTLALNSLNRSMGMKDAYPFVLSPKVLEKLRFVHVLIQSRRAEKKAESLRPTG